MENIPAWAWLAIGVSMLFLVFILKRNPAITERESSSSSNMLKKTGAEVRDELDKLFIQIQEISREQIAKMDNKIRMLNQLLMESDEKKRILESLIKQAQEIKDKTPAIPKTPRDPIHQKVISMHDNGSDIGTICRELGLERGEVELILGLRKFTE